MAATGMIVFNSSVVTAGSGNTHDIAGAATMSGLPATELVVTNEHATEFLEITFSSDGTNFTALEFTVGGAKTVVLRGLFAAVKVDSTGNNTGYSIFASRVS